jgi:hypothetical protein
VALADATADASAVAAALASAGADMVLLSAARDSAWFAQVAQGTQLTLSGPGRTGSTGLALLSRLKVLGDTALVLPAGQGGQLHVMDALYEIAEGRHVDMMLMEIAPGTDVREAVRSLLAYYATDVGGTAAVLLALVAPSGAAADSAGVLLRSAFGNALECDGESDSPPASAGRLRLFYGPQARIACERGQLLPGTPPGIVARVVVGRR